MGLNVGYETLPVKESRRVTVFGCTISTEVRVVDSLFRDVTVASDSSIKDDETTKGDPTIGLISKP